MENLNMENLEAGASVPEYKEGGSDVEQKELSTEAGEVIEKMKLHKFYEDDLDKLPAGEMPSRQLATNLICTILKSEEYVLPLEYAKILMRHLDYNKDEVSEFLKSRIITEVMIDDRRLEALEMLGIDIMSLREQAINVTPRLNWAVASDIKKEEERKKILEKWKKTFKITDEEIKSAIEKV